MEKEFVPYELAVKLKTLGFDEPCFGFYQLEYGEIRPIMVDDDEQYRLTGFRTCKNSEIPKHYTSAPTFSQAFRWFDYSTEWSGFIVPSKEEGCFEWWIQNYEDPNYLTIESDDWYRGREEAELACLEKLIEIIESK